MSDSDNSLWRLHTVQAHTGLPRSTIYHLMSLDRFPQNINLGPRSVAWIAEEILEWNQDRINESRKDDER